MAFCPIKLYDKYNDDCLVMLVHGAAYGFTERSALVRWKQRYLTIVHDEDDTIRIHRDIYNKPIMTVPSEVKSYDLINLLNMSFHNIKRNGVDDFELLNFGLDMYEFEPYCS